MKGPVLAAAAALLITVSHAASGQSADKLVLVVNPNNPLTAADEGLIRNIYLGRTRFWDDGQPLVAFGRPDDTPAGVALLKQVLHMTPAHYRHYWLERQLSGEGAAPIALPDARSAIAQVAARRGAVCYLTESEAKEAQGRVKVIPVP